MRKIPLLALTLALALAAVPAPTRADDHDDGPGRSGWRHGGHDDDDHDRARRAVLAGEILPLGRVLDRVERDFGGEMIEAELDTHHGQPVYEIKLIDRDGTMRKLIYDARDGTLLKSKERR